MPFKLQLDPKFFCFVLLLVNEQCKSFGVPLSAPIQRPQGNPMIIEAMSLCSGWYTSLIFNSGLTFPTISRQSSSDLSLALNFCLITRSRSRTSLSVVAGSVPGFGSTVSMTIIRE